MFAQICSKLEKTALKGDDHLNSFFIFFLINFYRVLDPAIFNEQEN